MARPKCQQPLTLLLTPCPYPVRSLEYNQLCGLDRNGKGTYTAEGIIKLSDALKVNKSLTSLRCAATAHHLPNLESVSSR